MSQFHLVEESTIKVYASEVFEFKSLMGREFPLMICPLLTHGSCKKIKFCRNEPPYGEEKVLRVEKENMEEERNHPEERFLNL